jgi:hypothetical protein
MPFPAQSFIRRRSDSPAPADEDTGYDTPEVVSSVAAFILNDRDAQHSTATGDEESAGDNSKPSLLPAHIHHQPFKPRHDMVIVEATPAAEITAAGDDTASFAEGHQAIDLPLPPTPSHTPPPYTSEPDITESTTTLTTSAAEYDSEMPVDIEQPKPSVETKAQRKRKKKAQRKARAAEAAAAQSAIHPAFLPHLSRVHVAALMFALGAATVLCGTAAVAYMS